jgi:hypothetical protein
VTVKLYTLAAENKPGILGQIAGAFNDAGINIDAFSAGVGGLRFITPDDAGTHGVLDGLGIAYTEEEVIEIELPNKRGQLARVATAFGEKNVNIHVSFGAGKGEGGASIYIGVDDVDGAWEALEALPSE